MRLFKLSGEAVATDADGLANNVTLATAATLTANDAGDSLAHIITVLNNTANDHSGKTITITGTHYGKAISQTITGPAGAATVQTTLYFSTVTAVTISATAGADTFDIGWLVNSVTETCYIGRINNPGAFSMGFGCDITSGSPTYTVEECYGNADATAYFAHTDVSAETTNQKGGNTIPLNGFRLLFTAAGGVEMAGVWVA